MNAITNSLAKRLVEDSLARKQIGEMGRRIDSMDRPYEISDSKGRKYFFVLARYS